MTILRAGDRPDFHTLPAGQVLTVVPSPVGTGVVWQYPDTGSNPTSGTPMTGSSLTVGPFTGSVRLGVECRSGAIDWIAGRPATFPAPALSDTQVAQTAAAVSEAWKSATSVAAPYRLGFLGDSRTSLLSTTQIGGAGSGVSTSGIRIPHWVCAYLHDSQYVAAFGVPGDTLISASTSTGWDGVARVNSKTLANLLAVGVDGVYIQYGINDLPGATSANLIAAAKALVTKLVSSGIKVVLSNIMLFDPTAASPNISPANAAATLVKINEFRDAMASFMAGLAGRAVFVDPNPLIALPATGYGDPQYFQPDTLGVHPNRRGAQIIGQQAAVAMRTLLPERLARYYTQGPLYQPNLIDPASSTTNIYTANSVVGTSTGGAASWNVDAATGMPYVEATFTVTALASGLAQVYLKVEATDCQGATPKYPIAAGDMIQGSARVTVDDGAGNAPAGLQTVQVRTRMYNTSAASQFFTEWDGVSAALVGNLTLPFDCRAVPPAAASPIASVNIDTPNSSFARGFFLAAFVEVTAIGTYRVRMYAPSLRVISRPQPFTVTPGASPYLWQNNPQPFVANDWVNSTGRAAQITVSGGTVSQIAIGRGATIAGAFPGAVNTGLTAGTFVLQPGDGIVVTYSAAPTMTVMYL